MSDMYLELVSRIPVVADQTYIGTDRMVALQKGVGLSNEAIARKIHISEKTWRRWKERGEIPTSSLAAAATALRMELRELSSAGVLAPASAEQDQKLDQILSMLHQLDSRLAALEGDQHAPEVSAFGRKPSRSSGP